MYRRGIVADCVRPARHGWSRVAGIGTDRPLRHLGADLARRPGRTAPGPDIGDYLGLPINDARRMRGESWDASILTMEEHTCKPHPSTYGPRGVGNMRVTPTTTRRRSQVKDRHAHPVDGAAARDLDGRPPASARLRCAHVAGILDRPMGGERAGGRDEPPEGRMDPSQRPGAQRSCADDRAVLPPRRSPHAHLDHRRPGLSDRAAREDQRLPADDARSIQPYPCQPAVEVERDPGDVPHHLPGQNPYLRSSRRSTTCRSMRRAAGRRPRCPSSQKMVRK